MSSWVALNVEPDEAVEEEIDDTKEVQVEEALKLYQNALKLHSQGPQSYAQAAEAYDALLKSEIFQCQDPLFDPRRSSLVQDPESHPPAVEEPVGETDINNSTSSTLFQTIYLSYKNYGQYLLDSLHDFLRNSSQTAHSKEELAAVVTTRSSSALSSFADALERDDTDLDLWRKSARLSSALQSYRLARYCLESVLADDDNRLEVRREQLGLDETCAEDSLRKMLGSIDDRLWVSQVPLRKPKQALLRFLKRHIDPYPYLPSLPADLKDSNLRIGMPAALTTYHTVRPTASTWLAVGEAVLQTLIDEERDATEIGPGVSVNIHLPTDSLENTSSTIALDESSKNTTQDPSIRQNGTAELKDNNQSMLAESPLTEAPKGDADAKHPEDQSLSDRGVEKRLVNSTDPQIEPAAVASNGQENANIDDLEHHNFSINAGRKRSSTSAANEDQVEGGRTKSRRTRARESNNEGNLQDEVSFDQMGYYNDQLGIFFEADDLMFGVVDSLLSKVGIEGPGTASELRKQTSELDGEKDDMATTKALRERSDSLVYFDLRKIIINWNEESSQMFRTDNSLAMLQDLQAMNKSGFAVFLEHTTMPIRKPGIDKTLSGGEGLPTFLSTINNGWNSLRDVSLKWLQSLLMPDYGENSMQSIAEFEGPMAESTYTSHLWPDTLKETVVQILMREDEHIYRRMEEAVTDLEHQVLHDDPEGSVKYYMKRVAELEMIQSIFELHFESYVQISNSASETNQSTCIVQRDRLERWSMLARTSLSYFVAHCPEGKQQNSVALRHLLASTLQSSRVADVQREHTLMCLESLKRLLHFIGNPVIHLANNSAMPEVSANAIDQEVSKLRSTDYFSRIFDPSAEDPVDLIEKLEPILEPTSIQYIGQDLSEDDEGSCVALQGMRAFLDRGDATLRLFLWRKLQDAYKEIDYLPKVVSCHLRSIEIIVKEIWKNSLSEERSAEERQTTLLKWLNTLEVFLTKAVTLVSQEPEKTYECVDTDHLKTSISAVARLLRLFYSLVLYEDLIRVGQTSGPELRGSLLKSLQAFQDRMHDMQINCWILLYSLLKEAILQNQELFSASSEDRIQFLCSVHNALGIRSLCKCSSKRFLKLVKSELFALENQQEYGSEICQVLFDLYGVRFTTSDDLSDHGCPAEKLGRPTAIMMIDIVIAKARSLNLKDLSKSELKPTIDRMQQAIGLTKSSSPLMFNRRILSAYLKSPIDPARLYRAVQGIGDLSMTSVPTESAEIAKRGWYFLLGFASLTRFRSQKRLSPVSTTDLDDAITYFRQDIEHGTGNWESWYRLAQTYDSKLDEDLTWSAEKLNNNQAELVSRQRFAIHCYSMAVATAIRTVEPTAETSALLSELHADFAYRLYASSREPLSMAAFSLVDFIRHFHKEDSHEMYKGRPFKQMKLYSVWNLTSCLLKRAIVGQPKRWT